MLAAALADPNPVLIFEHVMLYNRAGVLPPGAGPVNISTAVVRRPGKDMTLITYGGTLFKTLAAAESLAKEG
jgi:pyruvate dehydrogenase E1 component beta subunit/2-oxoisovalerate dehydrogenase E1 component